MPPLSLTPSTGLPGAAPASFTGAFAASPDAAATAPAAAGAAGGFAAMLAKRQRAAAGLHGAVAAAGPVGAAPASASPPDEGDAARPPAAVRTAVGDADRIKPDAPATADGTDIAVSATAALPGAEAAPAAMPDTSTEASPAVHSVAPAEDEDVSADADATAPTPAEMLAWLMHPAAAASAARVPPNDAARPATISPRDGVGAKLVPNASLDQGAAPVIAGAQRSASASASTSAGSAEALPAAEAPTDSPDTAAPKRSAHDREDAPSAVPTPTATPALLPSPVALPVPAPLPTQPAVASPAAKALPRAIAASSNTGDGVPAAHEARTAAAAGKAEDTPPASAPGGTANAWAARAASAADALRPADGLPGSAAATTAAPSPPLGPNPAAPPSAAPPRAEAPERSAPEPAALPAMPTIGGIVPQRIEESPAPVVHVATPTDAPEFREVLGLQISRLAGEGVHRAELSLNPADMGPISVRIDMHGDQARVDFSADSAETRALIEAGWAELATSLQDAGFTLSGGGVSEHSRQRPPPDAAQPGAGKRFSLAVGGTEPQAAAPAAARPRPLPGAALDLYA